MEGNSIFFILYYLKESGTINFRIDSSFHSSIFEKLKENYKWNGGGSKWEKQGQFSGIDSEKNPEQVMMLRLLKMTLYFYPLCHKNKIDSQYPFFYYF